MSAGGVLTVDLLSAEIGSTTTVVSAFDGLGLESGSSVFRGSGEKAHASAAPDAPHRSKSAGVPRFLGQGSAPTSVYPPQADVRLGLEAAISDLAARLGYDRLEWRRFSASSSAAGGLRMSVHGLVYDMTVKAAREAALGAGANIIHVTAGRLRRLDIKKTIEHKPNIIMIAGGLDYGERDTALDNAELISAALSSAGLPIPVIYAGNIENHDEIREIFSGHASRLYICENVYPRIDELNIEPARRIIQDVFEQHIVHAPGMEHIRELVNGHIMPVPGAVMASARLLRESIGDVVVFDVGGATTDIHSVCSDSPEIERILIAPEPLAKRSVEGDLGVYVNRISIVETAGCDAIAAFLSREAIQTPGLHPGSQELEDEIRRLPPIPVSAREKALVRALTFHACRIALQRHAGCLRELYSISGKETLAEGKDLSAVQYLLATGGALTRLPDAPAILRAVLAARRGAELYPLPNTPILLDNDYIMATMGVLAGEYPREALWLLKKSLGIHNE